MVEKVRLTLFARPMRDANVSALGRIESYGLGGLPIACFSRRRQDSVTSVVKVGIQRVGVYLGQNTRAKPRARTALIVFSIYCLSKTE